MQLHADRTRQALVRSRTLDWIPSPLKGVERRMLERDGEEVARATTIVRYAPKSFFSAHTHTGGEEFLVLDGVFSDEHGDFPAGTYVRNPVGSSHTPHSKDGTTILVKLWQMPASDQKWVRVNTLDDVAYRDAGGGLRTLPLHETGHETVEMWRLEPGAAMPAIRYKGGVELFVVDGEISATGEALKARDWLRLPVGSSLAVASAKGARVFVKHGYLASDLPGPNGA